MGLGIPQARLPWKPLVAALVLTVGAAGGCIDVPQWVSFTQQVGTADVQSDMLDGGVPEGDGGSDSGTDGGVADTPVDTAPTEVDGAGQDAPTSNVTTQTLGSRDQGATPLLVMFDAVNVDVSDSELLTGAVGDIGQLDFFWDFGDGASARGMLAPHVFETAQAQETFTVTLTVRNRAGVTERFTQDITVETIPAAQTFCLFDDVGELPSAAETPECGNAPVANKDIEAALLTMSGNTRQILLERGGFFELSVPGRRLFKEGLRIAPRATGGSAKTRIYVEALDAFTIDAHDIAISDIEFGGNAEGAPCVANGSCVLVRPHEDRDEPTFDHFLLHRVNSGSYHTVLGQSGISRPRWSAAVEGEYSLLDGSQPAFHLAGTGNALTGLTLQAWSPTRPDSLVCDGGCDALVVKDNTILFGNDGGATSTVLDIGVGHPSSRVLIQGNTISVQGGPQAFLLGVEASGVVAERNVFATPDGLPDNHAAFIVAEGSDILVRHNVMNLSMGDTGDRGVWLTADDAAAYNNTCLGTDPGMNRFPVCIDAASGDVRANLSFGGTFEGSATDEGNLIWPFGSAGTGDFNTADAYRVQATEGAATLFGGDGSTLPGFADFAGQCIPIDAVRFGAWQVVQGETPDGTGCSGD